MYRSQQYLPFTVLKPAEYGRYFTSPIGESQQYLPFTVLKHRICLPTLATLGSQQYLPFTVLKLTTIKAFEGHKLFKSQQYLLFTVLKLLQKQSRKS